jgi:hypothetical protein
MFRDRFRRAGGAPKAFDNIKALLDAAGEELAPGYYQTLNPKLVTYWDGVEFSNFPVAVTKLQNRMGKYNAIVQFASPNTAITEPADGGDIDTGTAWVVE